LHLFGDVVQVVRPFLFMGTYVASEQSSQSPCAKPVDTFRYRAANWIELGQSQGRGKDDLAHRPNRTLKTILGLPLCRDYRERLLLTA